MTPTQRRAAERLVEGPRTSSVLWGRAVIALLRELLAAEQVQKPAQKKPSTASQFESVKEAKKVAEAQLSYYRKMMADKSADPVVNQQMTTEPVHEPVAWLNPKWPEYCGPESPVTTFEMRGWIPLYTSPQQSMRCPEDGGACGAGGYCRPEPQQRKPLTRSMQAEIECDCLVAWNASTYGHSKQDTVHPMFLSAFILGYWTAERAHGITGAPT